MPIRDWSSDVCSSDLQSIGGGGGFAGIDNSGQSASVNGLRLGGGANGSGGAIDFTLDADVQTTGAGAVGIAVQSIGGGGGFISRSEEHTSELQSLMRISYAVFCLKKKNNKLYILK